MKDQLTPPKLPLRFLRWFCTDERLEEIEGDLYEIWFEQAEETTQFKANMLYWWLVFRSLRRFALTRHRTPYKSGFIMFFRHHLTVTYRNLWRHKVTTAINVLGLAIGISAFIAIMNVVQFENSHNLHIPDKDRIYRIYTQFNGAYNGLNRGVARALVPYLKENQMEVEALTSFYTRTYDAVPQSQLENNVVFDEVKALLADTAYFQVFDQYEWLVGDKKSALKNPFSLVLTEDQFVKYFGEKPVSEALDQEVVYQDSLRVKITGIVKQLHGRTDFIFTDIISQATVATSWLKDNHELDWQSTSSYSQAWIKAHTPLIKLSSHPLLQGANEFVAELEAADDYKSSFHFQPLAQLHTGLDLEIFDNRGRYPANASILWVLSVVSFAVLLIAIFNFINLESAQLSANSKEAGVRKVLGGHSRLLFYRFLMQSMTVCFLAIVLAIPLAHFGLLYFESFLPDAMPLDMEAPLFWLFIVGLFLIVGVVSGVYPAIVLSSIRTSQALKATAVNITGGKRFPIFRKVLISLQFAFSQLLLICTLAATLQIAFMLKKDLGFQEENVLYVYTPWKEARSKQEVFMNYLKSESLFQDVMLQDNPPSGNGTSYNTNIVHYMHGDEELKVKAERKRGLKGYIDFYGIPMLAGNAWVSDEQADRTLINLSLSKVLGFAKPEEAVGKRFQANGGQWYTIDGVFNDFHSRSMHSEILPMFFCPPYGRERCVSVKIAHKDTEMAIETMTDIWKKLYPKDPAEINFMDQRIAEYYEAEQQTSKLTGFTTFIAILISSLGLFGLVSLTIIHRTKEVGIRKVLGASVMQIGYLITSEFLIMTLIAFCLAVPGAYFIIDQWMSTFAYQIDISWWVYFIGGMVSVMVALLAISSKVYHSANTNPVEALRYE